MQHLAPGGGIFNERPVAQGEGVAVHHNGPAELLPVLGLDKGGQKAFHPAALVFQQHGGLGLGHREKAAGLKELSVVGPGDHKQLPIPALKAVLYQAGHQRPQNVLPPQGVIHGKAF